MEVERVSIDTLLSLVQRDDCIKLVRDGKRRGRVRGIGLSSECRVRVQGSEEPRNDVHWSAWSGQLCVGDSEESAGKECELGESG